MNAIFIRHGIAEDRSDSGRDMDRKLTEKGRVKALEAFTAVGRLFPGIGLIVSSEAIRARETADILALALAPFEPARMVTPLLNPGADYRSFKDLMREIGFHKESVCFIGHEPDFSRIVSGVVADGRLRLEVKKASCIVADMNSLCKGELTMVMRSSALRMMK